jgi:uncharacterized membrane protein YfbV (UPF0208 family)
MKQFLEEPMWAITTCICVIAICMTTYFLNVDPRIAIMTDCVRPIMNDDARAACADAVAKMEISE